MDTYHSLVRQKTELKLCPYCRSKMSYISLHGKYLCKQCDYYEFDLYGQMKQLLEDNPSLSKVELSMILDVPLRDLNKYIDDGMLNNPLHDIP